MNLKELIKIREDIFNAVENKTSVYSAINKLDTFIYNEYQEQQSLNYNIIYKGIIEQFKEFTNG